MKKEKKGPSAVQELRARLQAAEETLRAIRNGEVDALFVSTPKGDRIFTLKGADHSYQVLVETMNEGAVVLLPSGIVTYCNRHFAQILKSSVEKIVGSSIRSFIPPEDHRWFEALFQQGLEKNSRGEISLQTRDGEKVPVQLSINSLPMGTLPAACMVVTDLTSKKEAEQLRETLAHVGRVATVGELTASLAHELSQPLTAIFNNAQAAQRYLGRKPPDLEEVRTILEDIVHDDQRAGQVIQRLRGLLKKAPAAYEPVDLNEVVRELPKLLHTDSLLKDLSITMELNRSLPRVKGDRIQLQQVLLNLILNSADAMVHTAPGDRKLIIRTEKPEDRAVKLTVRDFGVGIVEEKVQRLFEPFYTTKPGGLGMGLSISRSIIEAHGGVMGALNHPEGGGLLLFSASRVFRRPGVNPSAPVVYVVDDDLSVRRSLARLIQSAGFPVETFPCGEEFLKRLPPERPSCLVLDIRMPGLSGLQLQEKLAAEGRLLPIIFITGHGTIPMSVKAMKGGALEFLQKPFNDRDLLDAIRNAITYARETLFRKQEMRILRQRFAGMTRRERDVFSLVVIGKLNKEIAHELGVTEKTVKFHRAHVMQKMGAPSLADLVRFAEKLSASPNPLP